MQSMLILSLDLPNKINGDINVEMDVSYKYIFIFINIT